MEHNTRDFSAIPITKNAAEKIRAYGVTAGRTELYGFLVSPVASRDGVIYDALLAKNQEVTGASGHLSGLAAVESKAEIENLGMKAMGFWHSHGSFGVFHSGIDNRNIGNLLMSFIGNTEEKEYSGQRQGFVPDYKNRQIVYRQKGLEFRFSLEDWFSGLDMKPVGEDYFNLAGEPDMQPLVVIARDKMGKLRLILKDDGGRIMASEPRTFETSAVKGENVKTKGVAYSIVTNAKGEFYGLLATNRWCSSCERDETETIEDAKFNVIEGEVTFDKEQIKRDLEERVKGFGKQKGGFFF